MNNEFTDRTNKEFYDFLMDNDFEIIKIKHNYDTTVYTVQDKNGIVIEKFQVANSNKSANKIIDLFLDFYESKVRE